MRSHPSIKGRAGWFSEVEDIATRTSWLGLRSSLHRRSFHMNAHSDTRHTHACSASKARETRGTASGNLTFVLLLALLCRQISNNPLSTRYTRSAVLCCYSPLQQYHVHWAAGKRMPILRMLIIIKCQYASNALDVMMIKKSCLFNYRCTLCPICAVASYTAVSLLYCMLCMYSCSPKQCTSSSTLSTSLHLTRGKWMNTSHSN